MQGTLALMKTLKHLAGYIYLTITSIISAWTILNVGYYETRRAEENFTAFFVKKQLTYKIAFINIYKSDHEENWN